MKKYLTPLVLLVCAVLFTGGCANTGALVVTGLRVELSDIQRSPDGSVSVTWRLVNPNVAPYLVSELRNKIFLNGTLVGTTDSREPIGIPVQSSATRTSNLHLADAAAERMLADAAGHGAVNYRINSVLVIQIYGDQVEKGEVSGSGTVTVINK